MERIIAMIPARMGSTRYPGKPLAEICGKTMIEHVWQRVRMSKRIAETYIITCDQEIMDCATKFGAKAIMTADTHTRCTDRAAEAANKLVMENGDNFDILLNIQGDEPLLNPNSIDLLIDPFVNEEDIRCVNLIEKLDGEKEIQSTNNIKVVFDPKGFVLFMSRHSIPYGENVQHYKQLGVYGLRRKEALGYSKMESGPLEITESNDMLRFIENRTPLRAIVSPYETFGVDCPADHEKVNALMEKDEFFKLYR